MITVVISVYNVANFPDGGGHFWVYMQYVQGLRLLGCEVYWLEQLRPAGDPEREARLVSTFLDRMKHFGLEGRTLLYALDRDRVDGTTVRASQRGSTEGNASSFAPTVSPDGAFVAFATSATNLSGSVDANGSASDVYEFEVATKTLRRVSVDASNGWSDGPSSDPSYGLSSVLVFTSSATDLVNGDVDGVADVFARTWGTDRGAGTTALCSRPLPVG